MPIRKISAALVQEICSSIENLSVLNLSRNEIVCIENLERLSSLTKLDLSYNAIQYVQGLESLTNLTYVDLSNNKIGSLTGLERLASLETLHLADNQIASLDSLRSLTYLRSLHTLTLRGNALATHPNHRTSVAQRLPSLRVLDGQPLPAESTDPKAAYPLAASVPSSVPTCASSSSPARKQLIGGRNVEEHDTRANATCLPHASSASAESERLSPRCERMGSVTTVEIERERERYLAMISTAELRHREQQVTRHLHGTSMCLVV